MSCRFRLTEAARGGSSSSGRCGKVVMHNESHAARWRDRRLADILGQIRHDGCGGYAAKAELLTGIEGASSRPVWRIVLREGLAARGRLVPDHNRRSV